VRYLSEFLIGFGGAYAHAMQIRNDISSFLKSDLLLKVKDAHIVHRNGEAIVFLGHLVKMQEFKARTNQISKNLRVAINNKKKRVGRFYTSDKSLACAKKYQLCANVLKNMRSIVSNLNVSLDNKTNNVNVVSMLIAYKAVGATIIRSLGLKT
jgi:hypothetical protein